MKSIIKVALAVVLLCLFLACSSGGGGSDSGGGIDPGPAELLVFDNFAGGTFDPFWNDTPIQTDNYFPNTPEQPFVSSPRPVFSGTHSAHYFLVNGTDEQTSIRIGHTGFSVEEFYLEWYEFLAENYPRPKGQKMSRFNGGSLEVNVINLNQNRNLQINWLALDGREGFINTNRGLPVGEWFKIGFWVRLNTLGERNGFVRCYINDSLIASLDNQEIRTSAETWERMWVGGNYTNQGLLSSGGSRYIDNISWYSTKP